jgi:hypothetical protein
MNSSVKNETISKFSHSEQTKTKNNRTATGVVLSSVIRNRNWKKTISIYIFIPLFFMGLYVSFVHYNFISYQFPNQ